MTDGHLDLFTAKTAVGLLRYCSDEVVAVLDREHAGGDLEALVGIGAGVPIVDSIASARRYQPDRLVLGAVFPGGRLPVAWRVTIREALAEGLDVVSGLHSRLNDDDELAQCAAGAGQRMWDVRACDKTLTVGTGKARQTRAKRILTVGTDCNLGKRLTAIELVRELSHRKLRAEFVPTGQTGVMIAGSGVVLDAVASDFVSGAVEAEVLEHGEADYVVVEGQGALLHPSFSAVTLGLMHGVLPDLLVLCHAPLRDEMRHTNIPIPPLAKVMQLYQAVLAPIHQARFIGVALNCHGMGEREFAEALSETRARTGLPVVDPVRTGVADLADAVCTG